ncbi:Vacuolar protein sorting-associated protein 22 homolog 1-like protein [Drosera capensis]
MPDPWNEGISCITGFRAHGYLFISGVQIVEICLATRPHNGGLISLQELCTLVGQKRENAREPVTEDDFLRAISKLKVLGSGYEVFSVGKKKLVRSVPNELNKDHNEIFVFRLVYFLSLRSPVVRTGINCLQCSWDWAQGFVTVDEVERRLSWSSGRAVGALDTLLEEGLAMIDDGHRDGKRRFWFQCVSSIASIVGTDAIAI